MLMFKSMNHMSFKTIAAIAFIIGVNALANKSNGQEPLKVKDIRALYQSMQAKYIDDQDPADMDATPVMSLSAPLYANGIGGDFTLRCSFDAQQKKSIVRFCRIKSSPSNLQPKVAELVYNPKGELVFAFESKPLGANPATDYQELRYYFDKNSLIFAATKDSIAGQSSTPSLQSKLDAKAVRLIEQNIRHLIDAQEALKSN
jgi:hypothetical protein